MLAFISFSIQKMMCIKSVDMMVTLNWVNIDVHFLFNKC
jgi:hypothetical protein